VLADIELAGIIADDNGGGQEAVRLDTAPQGPLGGDHDRIGIDLERGDAEPFEMGVQVFKLRSFQKIRFGRQKTSTTDESVPKQRLLA
jgi:hypothetical protein